MKCTVCGNEFDEAMELCPKCGTRKLEMVGLNKPEEKETEEKKSIDYGYGSQKMDINQLIIKDRKASSLAGIDPKKIVIAVIGIIIAVLLIMMTLVDHVLKKTVNAGRFTVSIPVSMKSIDDSFYSLVNPESEVAYSNRTLELFCIEYDIYKLYPDARQAPDPSEFEAYATYLEKRDTADAADREILKELDEQMSYDLKDYKQIELMLNELSFTYRDSGFDNNYGKIVSKKSDDKVYLFVCLCAENEADNLEGQIDKIMNSITEK